MSTPAFEVGQDYITRGGWKARVIWRFHCASRTSGYYLLAIHQLGTPDESGPIRHHFWGAAIDPGPVSFGRPPTYGLHPADLIGPWPSAPDRPESAAAVVTEDDGFDVPVMEGSLA